MSVRLGTTTEVMASYYAGEPPPFARAGNIDELVVLKDIDQHLVTDLDLAVRLSCRILTCCLFLSCLDRSRHCHFAHELHRRKLVLTEMSLHRLRDAATLDELDESHLHCIVPIAYRVFAL